MNLLPEAPAFARAPWLAPGWSLARRAPRDAADSEPAPPGPLRADAAARVLDSPFARDVIDGLGLMRKSIPATWLYDQRGSELFEAITGLDEYYPSRTEVWILQSCAAQIAAAAGRGATVVELGSGSSRKTPLLLEALDAPAAYVPIDISAEALAGAVASLRPRFPALRIEPLVADFTRLTHLPALPLPAPGRPRGRRVLFFPGSTIGNFTPEAAVGLLARLAQAAGDDALLIVGADATQDPRLLIPAYDDRRGVTAAFNKNLLARINRELDGDFDLDRFDHQARWDAQQQRVEMHLVSRGAQQVTVLGRRFGFADGETLHTENSYKHGLLKFRALVARAGWAHRQFWMDSRGRYAVHVLERSSA